MASVGFPAVYGTTRMINAGVVTEWTCIDFSYTKLLDGWRHLSVLIQIEPGQGQVGPAHGQILISKKLFLLANGGVFTTINDDLGEEIVNQSATLLVDYATPQGGFDITFSPNGKKVDISCHLPEAFDDPIKVSVFLQEQYQI